jgi:cellulose biosynthesis protein BcsQ
MIYNCLNSLTFYESITILFGGITILISIAGGFFKLGRMFGRRYRNITSLDIGRNQSEDLRAEMQKARSQLQVHIRRAEELEQVISGAANIWLRPTNYNFGQAAVQISQGRPVITVANFKGGVAKSTLAANLAAYFSRDRAKRVLLIDLDYQGTLSDGLLTGAEIQTADSSSHKLLLGEEDIDAVFHQSIPLSPLLPKCRLFPSFYDLAGIENRIMFKWVIKGDSDARFNLHKYVHSKKFQDSFDMTIIDAPPRLLTGMTNAICATSHVIISSVLDARVTQATLNTLRVLYNFKGTLCPSLNVLGIVPTLVTKQKSYNDRENRALKTLKEKMHEFWPNGTLPDIFEDTPICRREDIAASAGSELYPFGPRTSDSSKIIVNFAENVSRRVGV